MVFLSGKLVVVVIVFGSSSVFAIRRTTSEPNMKKSKGGIGVTTFNPKYVMWRFKNFPTQERYVRMKNRRLPTESTTPRTEEPKNGESDWKMIEVKETKTNGHPKRRAPVNVHNRQRKEEETKLES